MAESGGGFRRAASLLMLTVNHWRRIGSVWREFGVCASVEGVTKVAEGASVGHMGTGEGVGMVEGMVQELATVTAQNHHWEAVELRVTAAHDGALAE